MTPASDIIAKFVNVIIDPAIAVITAAGFFLFVWGLVQFLYNLNEGGENSTGKQHMLWGVIGMFVMLSVFGIINLITGTFNIDYKNPDTSSLGNVPSVNIGGR